MTPTAWRRTGVLLISHVGDRLCPLVMLHAWKERVGRQRVSVSPSVNDTSVDMPYHPRFVLGDA